MFNSLFRMILNSINGFVGNYALAVILFTVLIKLLVLPLDIKSKKSMRAMTALQPKIEDLKAKYGKDPDKLNQKTMELYKKEKVSPTAGCLPLLIQLPILFIMFGAMRDVANEQTIAMIMNMADQVAAGINPENVEVAFEGFLWIKNLFQPDTFTSLLPAFGDKLAMIGAVDGSSILTAENIEAARTFLASEAYEAIAIAHGAGEFVRYPIPVLVTTLYITIPSSIHSLLTYTNGLFILPLMAGASQWLMTKLTGNSSAQQQQGMGFMNWFFPLFSIYICLSYNAAFSLYWVVSNLIAMVQQYAVNKALDMKEKKAEA